MEIEEVKKQMQKTLSFLEQELSQIKTGRATPSLVERILVEAYETKMPLVELATITAPEPNEILVAPFDQSIIKNIEKAIGFRKELGLSPVVDEALVRIKIAPLTEEKRKELVKVLASKLEIGRVAIRQIRHEERSRLKKQFEEGEINEDERRNQETKLQELTDEMNEEIQKMGDRKEREILGD
ncbi:MAG: ribosome recycling factor [Candidatus Pacebacteria bacterium]|nr:ribosome recycling factor [Candidatus Paceibacterota bacterium]